MAKGLLVRAKYPVDGRQVSVGTDAARVAFSFDEDEPLTDVIPFQPSRVSAAQLPHRLAVQSLRLAMEAWGLRLAVPAPYGPEGDEGAGRAGGAGRQNGGV
ncbi:replication-relaxation family protein [Klebsiella pneumoniae]|nr:replication-relaxation family protein [Klebsiella pneumoniae]